MTNDAPIYSSLAGDPDFRELLEMFAESMEEKKVLLQETQSAGNWEEMGRHAHQLKGAGGGYGFSGLTDVASALEICCKADQVNPAELTVALNNVLSYLDRIRI